MTINILEKKQEDTPTIAGGTGPTQLSGTQNINKFYNLWDQIKKQAQDDNPHASALLELKQQIIEENLKLKKEGESFKQDLTNYQRSLKQVNNLIVGILVVTSIAFITTLSLVFLDLIKDKDLYLQNNNLYQDYTNKNSKLSDTINDQKIEISNLKNEIQRIYDKNNYLK